VLLPAPVRADQAERFAAGNGEDSRPPRDESSVAFRERIDAHGKLGSIGGSPHAR
jgi:hypothetical protein